MKKEFDDFKRNPEYNNFVREECISSSSSDEDDEDRDTRPEAFSLSDHYRRAEEEDLEHVVPRGLWSGGNKKRRSKTVFKYMIFYDAVTVIQGHIAIRPH